MQKQIKLVEKITYCLNKNGQEKLGFDNESIDIDIGG